MRESKFPVRRTVLLAEHQAVAGMWLEDVLADAGFAVDGPHPSCEAAIAALACCRPDYAVVNVDLSQGPCFALACALRMAGVPFVLLSESARVLPAFRDVPVLERPVADVELIAGLEHAVRVRERHRRRVAACPRLGLAAPLALDQCPPACGA